MPSDATRTVATIEARRKPCSLSIVHRPTCRLSRRGSANSLNVSYQCPAQNKAAEVLSALPAFREQRPVARVDRHGGMVVAGIIQLPHAACSPPRSLGLTAKRIRSCAIDHRRNIAAVRENPLRTTHSSSERSVPQ